MQTGFFEKQIVLTPDLCGSAAALSPLAAFTIFQGVASEHKTALLGQHLETEMGKLPQKPFHTV